MASRYNPGVPKLEREYFDVPYSYNASDQRFTQVFPKPSNFVSPKRTEEKFSEASTVAMGSPIRKHS